MYSLAARPVSAASATSTLRNGETKNPDAIGMDCRMASRRLTIDVYVLGFVDRELAVLEKFRNTVQAKRIKIENVVIM